MSTQLQTKESRLTPWQRSLVVGLLLGDGHLETQTKGRTYRLKVEHSEKQKDYLFWLFKQFQEWIPAKTPYRKVRSDGRITYGFATCSHGAFRFYAHQFYVDKQKIIPKLLGRMITPEALAIWFMDDGSKKSPRHTTYNIHTLGYTKRDLDQALKVFEEKYGIEATLHRQKGVVWRIYIPSRSVQQFESLIRDTVSQIPSMLYKLDNTMPKE